MDRDEYKVVHGLFPSEIQSTMNKLAEEGWQIMNVLPYNVYYFMVLAYKSRWTTSISAAESPLRTQS